MTGTPQRGDLYMTAKGRTVEILALADVESALVCEPVEVIAYRFVGAATVHLVGLHDVTEWVRIESV